MINRLHLLAVTETVLDLAGAFEAPALRTLDAVHIASALAVGDELDGFLSYDLRQVEAAIELGLPTSSPG